jgi:hypothetical protein
LIFFFFLCCEFSVRIDLLLRHLPGETIILLLESFVWFCGMEKRLNVARIRKRARFV